MTALNLIKRPHLVDACGTTAPVASPLGLILLREPRALPLNRYSQITTVDLNRMVAAGPRSLNRYSPTADILLKTKDIPAVEDMRKS